MAYLGHSPVQRAQENIARTVQGGLSEYGNRGLQKAEFDLKKAGLTRQVGREDEADRQRNVVFEQEQDEYAQQQKRLDEPIKLGDFAAMTYGPKASRETVMHTVSNGYMTDALKMGGVSLAEDGFLYRKDGSPVTGRDADRFAPLIGSVIAAKADPGHSWDQKIRELEKLPKRTPEQNAWLKKAKAKDPAMLISAYERQMETNNKNVGVLQAMGVTDMSSIEKSNARITKKIDRLYKGMDEKARRDFELKKLGISGAAALKAAGVRSGKKDGKASIEMPNGSKLTVSDARGLYRDFFSIPTEDTLMEMEFSDDPEAVESAVNFRALMNEKDMIKFFKRLQDEGLPQNWDTEEDETTAPDWRMYQSRSVE